MQRQVDQPTPEASAQGGKLGAVSKKIVDLEAEIEVVKAATPRNDVLYAALLSMLAALRTERNQLRETAKGAALGSQGMPLLLFMTSVTHIIPESLPVLPPPPTQHRHYATSCAWTNSVTL